MTLDRKFKGVIVPVVTPFSDGELAEQDLRNVIAYLRRRGVTNEFYLGETGEFRYLSIEERKRVIDVAGELKTPEVKILVGTSDTSLKDTVQLTRYAKDKGADAAVIAPHYQVSYSALEYVRIVLEGVGLPLIIYNNPAITNGRGFAAADLASLAATHKDRILGIKDSSGDQNYLEDLIRVRNKLAPWLSVLQGSEEALVENPKAEVDGIFAGTANSDPRLFLSIFQRIQERDFEGLEDYFARLINYFPSYREFGVVPEIKRRLNGRGLITSPELAPRSAITAGKYTTKK